MEAVVRQLQYLRNEWLVPGWYLFNQARYCPITFSVHCIQSHGFLQQFYDRPFINFFYGSVNFIKQFFVCAMNKICIFIFQFMTLPKAQQHTLLNATAWNSS